MSAHFQSGEVVPANGIYRVLHREHRLPHEVTLYDQELFPNCSKCGEAVQFEPVRLVGPDAHPWGRLVLCSLPDEEELQAA